MVRALSLIVIALALNACRGDSRPAGRVECGMDAPEACERRHSDRTIVRRGPECGCYRDVYGDPWIVVFNGKRQRKGPAARE